MPPQVLNGMESDTPWAPGAPLHCCGVAQWQCRSPALRLPRSGPRVMWRCSPAVCNSFDNPSGCLVLGLFVIGMLDLSAEHPVRGVCMHPHAHTYVCICLCTQNMHIRIYMYAYVYMCTQYVYVSMCVYALSSKSHHLSWFKKSSFLKISRKKCFLPFWTPMPWRRRVRPPSQQARGGWTLPSLLETDIWDPENSRFCGRVKGGNGWCEGGSSGTGLLPFSSLRAAT